MPRASIVAIVSRSDSPFFTLLDATASERTSALRRLAAVSKLSRVRVDSSKKSEATTRPFKAGTFLMVRRFTSTNDSAVSSTSTIAALESGHRARAGCDRGSTRSRRLPRADPDAVEVGHDGLVLRRREILADVVGANRQLAVAAVDQHRQLHGAGPAPVGQRVERGADGATGEEDVVDQYDRAIGEVVIDRPWPTTRAAGCATGRRDRTRRRARRRDGFPGDLGEDRRERGRPVLSRRSGVR